MRFKPAFFAIAAAASLFATAGNATELVTNGNFESGTYGDIGHGGSVTGWNTNDGYTFLYSASNDDKTGVPNRYNEMMQLWGPKNNGAAGNTLGASPAGGNYLAADGAYITRDITQTISGLTVGQQYNLTFYWAGAQQKGYDGATSEQWKVTFGNDAGDVRYTDVLQNAEHGFTGWHQETMTFTANKTSELLSFLAIGTPTGEPPFSLLDGVSMQAVPEPGSVALMGLGLGLLTFAARRRKSK